MENINKLKYLKYKKKYINLKSMIGGGKRKKKRTKGGKKVEIEKYVTMVNTGIYTHFELQMLLEFEHLTKNILIYILDNNINTIVGIGDSPSFILGILQKFYEDHNTLFETGRLDFNFLYFPISNITNADSNNLKDKLSSLENNKKLHGNILWLDYVSSGNSIYNFMNSLSKKILSRSKFFLYGNPIFKDHKLKKFKNKFYNIYYNFDYFMNTFFAHIFGDSERFSMRCVEYKDVTKNNFDIILYNNIPTNKSKISKDCKSMYETLFFRLSQTDLINGMIKVVSDYNKQSREQTLDVMKKALLKIKKKKNKKDKKK